MRRKKERSKQGQTNKAKQHSTPKAVTFPRKNELPQVGLEPTTLYACTCHSSLGICGYNYKGGSTKTKPGEGGNLGNNLLPCLPFASTFSKRSTILRPNLVYTIFLTLLRSGKKCAIYSFSGHYPGLCTYV